MSKNPESQDGQQVKVSEKEADKMDANATHVSKDRNSTQTLGSYPSDQMLAEIMQKFETMDSQRNPEDLLISLSALRLKFENTSLFVMLSIGDLDSSDSESTVESYVFQKPLEEPTDLLENVLPLPEVEEITLEARMSIVPEVQQVVESGISKPKEDIGSFVDPLTGILVISDDEPEPAIELGPEEEPEQDNSLSESEPEDNELLKFELLDKEEVQEVKIVVDADDEAEDTLKYFQEVMEPVIIKEEAPIAESDDPSLQKIKQVDEFLMCIINQVVDICEYVDPKKHLLENLDKRKLFELFRQQMEAREYQLAEHRFLNRRAVDHFRHKKLYHQILPDFSTIEEKRYLDCLKLLDKTLGKERDLKRMCNEKIAELEAINVDLSEKAQKEINDLEELLRKTFIRNSSWQNMKQAVEKQCLELNHLRQEISKVRLVLLEKHHALAKLQNEINALEHIGDDLTLREFEVLQTEIQALDKKIEERNLELHRIRSRCNSDIHILANLKNNEEIVRSSNTELGHEVSNLIAIKCQKREELYNLKLEGSRIRKAINERSLECGLLDKPALMYDYDKTVEHINNLENKVNDLKKKYALVQQRIEKLQQHNTNVN